MLMTCDGLRSDWSVTTSTTAVDVVGYRPNGEHHLSPFGFVSNDHHHNSCLPSSAGSAGRTVAAPDRITTATSDPSGGTS